MRRRKGKQAARNRENHKMTPTTITKHKFNRRMDIGIKAALQNRWYTAFRSIGFPSSCLVNNTMFKFKYKHSHKIEKK